MRLTLFNFHKLIYTAAKADSVWLDYRTLSNKPRSVGEFLDWFFLSPVSRGVQNLVLSLVFGSLFVLFREQQDSESEHVDLVDKRMTRMIEHFALGTGPGGKLESLILDLKSKGKVRWLVAKLVSEKLRRAFEEGENKDPSAISFEVADLADFQDLLKLVLDDCEKSILWTCPYVPLEWFNVASCDETAIKKRVSSLKTEDFKLHDKFMAVKLKQKSRAINLRKRTYDDMVGENIDDLYELGIRRWLLQRFIKINRKLSDNVVFYIVKDNVAKDDAQLWDVGIYDDDVTVRFVSTNDGSGGAAYQPNHRGDGEDLRAKAAGRIELRMSCPRELWRMRDKCLRFEKGEHDDSLKSVEETRKAAKENYDRAVNNSNRRGPKLRDITRTLDKITLREFRRAAECGIKVWY